MFNMTGSRGLGFASNYNGSDTEIREEMLIQLNLMNASGAEVKSSINAFQSLVSMAAQAVGNINADQNLTNPQITDNLEILNQMRENLNVLLQSVQSLEEMADNIEGRLP